MVFALLVSVAICTSRRWRESLDAFSPGSDSRREGEAPAEPQTAIQPAIEDAGRYSPGPTSARQDPRPPALMPPVSRLETESADTATRRWSLVVVFLLLAQLILGAFVRHHLSPLAQRGHLLVAFAVLAAIVWLAKSALTEQGTNRNVARAVRLMLVLVGVQLLLGVEAWMIRAPNLAAGSEVIVAEPSVSLLSRDVVRSLHVLVGSFLLSTGVVAALEAHRGVIARFIQVPARRRLEEAA
jgi:hypothetical protein